MIDSYQQPARCTVCGEADFRQRSVLWPELIKEWQLAPREIGYMEHQQGRYCTSCGSNLRSIALSCAILDSVGAKGTLSDFCRSEQAKSYNLLEINEAGALHGLLSSMPRYEYAPYPQVDIHNMPYADDTFDIVVHSDTLEHVNNPVHALAECRRVLRRGGHLCFTIPIITGRLTRSREGLQKSFHGAPDTTRDDFLVHTEFGADMWTFLGAAEFSRVSIVMLCFPAGISIYAKK